MFISELIETYSFGDYLRPCLLFDLLGVSPARRLRSGAGLGIVLLLVVIVGVAVKVWEVSRIGRATVEEICIKVRIIPKPDRSSTSAGLS